MPFGAFLDSLELKGKRKAPMPCAIFGIMLTILGAYIHPAILGVGNALFHVGAGVCVIREDDIKKLGVFVAPGAWGLFLGTQIINNKINGTQILFTVFLIIMLIIFTGGKKDNRRDAYVGSAEISLLICCFIVVIIRSYVGMAVTFSWKTTTFAATIAVLSVVLGKMAGGILAERLGTKITVVSSLTLSAVCYFFSSNMIVGLLALFLFNMTMPITLYLLVKHWKGLPGFCFGLLTFGLFLGFLPVYFGIQVPVSGQVIGVAGSLLSIVFLLSGKGWWSE